MINYLNYSQGLSALLEFWNTLDQDYLHKNLRDGCLSCHKPYVDWLESFCASEKELFLHQHIQAEIWKRYFCDPATYLPSKIKMVKSGYVSPLIKTLEGLRDLENGMDENRLRKALPTAEAWIKLQIDPSMKKRLELERNNISYLKSTEEKKRSDIRACLSGEAKYNEMNSVESNSDKIYDHLKELMIFYGGKIGFCEKKKALKLPYVTRYLGKAWELRWVCTDTSMLSSKSKSLEFSLIFCSPNFKFISKDSFSLEFLEIKYGALVPGFLAGYRSFITKSEIESIVRAHTILIDAIQLKLIELLNLYFDDN